jgi:hypothetical protein
MGRPNQNSANWFSNSTSLVRGWSGDVLPCPIQSPLTQLAVFAVLLREHYSAVDSAIVSQKLAQNGLPAPGHSHSKAKHQCLDTGRVICDLFPVACNLKLIFGL